MHRPTAAVGSAALIVACLAGCSSSKAPSAPAAGVTINGSNALQTQTVHCRQLQWTWMIDIGTDDGPNSSGAQINLDAGGRQPTAMSVHIHNVGGFSGIYSQGNGEADVRVSGETFTVSGTANGIHTDTHEPASAQYRIVTRC